MKKKPAISIGLISKLASQVFLKRKIMAIFHRGFEPAEDDAYKNVQSTLQWQS